jgi:hypothetical protein
MITQEEWDKLKQHEYYGMYIDLDRKIEKLMEKIEELDSIFRHHIKTGHQN